MTNNAANWPRVRWLPLTPTTFLESESGGGERVFQLIRGASFSIPDCYHLPGKVKACFTVLEADAQILRATTVVYQVQYARTAGLLVRLRSPEAFQRSSDGQYIELPFSTSRDFAVVTNLAPEHRGAYLDLGPPT